MVYLSSAAGAFISALIGALVGAFVTYVGRKRTQDKAEDDLLLCMSRASLFKHFSEVIDRGYVTAQEVEVYEPMYDAYTRRGGNSVIERLHGQVKHLPIQKEGK